MSKNHFPKIYFMAFNQSCIRCKFYSISHIFTHVHKLGHDKSDYAVEVYVDDVCTGLYVLGDYATLVKKS